MLVEKGADVNAQGGFYGNTLQAASAEGHTEIVRILVKKGADINAQGGYYGNALQAASAEGYTKIVKILVEKGADVNAQGGKYGNTLQAASVKGHEEIVNIFVKKGADVNAQGGFYGNALQAASYKGYEKIVKILVKKGTDVNVQDGFYGNALQATSAKGHTKIVRILVKKGADINAQGGYYGNALQAASAKGHTEIVKILVERGADVNTQGGKYGNALQAASYHGRKEIVRMLVGRGTDINAVPVLVSSWWEWCILQLQRLMRPRLQPGDRRIEWRCSCGSIQYSNFEDSNPEAVQRLVSELQSMWEPGATQAKPAALQSSSKMVMKLQPVHNPGRYQAPGPNARAGPAGSSGNTYEESAVGNDSQRSSYSPEEPNEGLKQSYIELCINTGRHLMYLCEIKVEDHFNDGMLFDEIWREYYLFRSRSDWQSRLRRIFKKPIDVHWVKPQFGLPSGQPDLVDIYEKPHVVPPVEEVRSKRYRYHECPMDPLPPMNFNNFYHYLDHARRDGACLSPQRHPRSTWFKRFPKKYGSIHDAPEAGTFVSGWGLHIVEGARKTAVFCVLLSLFATAIAVGVLYAAVYKTQEQGWGISAVLAAFLFGVIGSLYTYWDEEYS
ncbi:hypothetical protein DL764_009659 [Monosporascus ibericus]|uniref:Uncharacterized protein n=1 Tax=Monosporascus ibericus TaxID=155417 RepID=A0A4V1X8X2_9PEZI|nr:hypothetical protein DL764_009659 [Monosporascus ibericus]